MDLPLNDRLCIGVQTIHRRTEPAEGPWLPTIDEMRTLVELGADGGARLSESFTVLRKLWSGEPTSHAGRFFQFEEVMMQPPPRQAGGPRIWCGGRSEPALRRIGRLADGWMSYVVTPDMFRQGL